MTFKIAVVQVSADTGGGMQTILAPDLGGLTPKLVRFFANQGISDGVVAPHKVISVGASDGVNEFFGSVTSTDNVSPSDANNRSGISGCINISRVNSGTLDPRAKASLDSFIPDGCVINWLNTPENTYQIIAIFYAGTEFSGSVQTASLGLINVDTDITTTFPVDVVHSYWDDDQFADSGNNPGAAAAYGIVHNGATVEQRSFTQKSQHNVATAIVRARNSNAYGLTRMKGGSSAIDMGVDFHTFTPTGFKVTPRAGNANTTIGLVILSLGTAKSFLQTIASPVAAGNDSTFNVGFIPAYAETLVQVLPTINTGLENNTASPFGFSFVTSASQHFSAIADQRNVSPTNSESLTESTAISLNDYNGIDMFDASFVSFDSDGRTYNFSNADPLSRPWFELYISDVTGGTGLFEIQNNSAVPSGPSLSSRWDSNRDDHRVNVIVNDQGADNPVAIFVRMDDTTIGNETGYVALIDFDANLITLYKSIAGVRTPLATSNYAFISGTDYDVEVKIVVDQIDISISPVSQISIKDASIQTGTFISIQSDATWNLPGPAFKDITVSGETPIAPANSADGLPHGLNLGLNRGKIEEF